MGWEYLLAIIGLAIIWASWITYAVSETSLTKQGLFLVHWGLSSAQTLIYAFFLFVMVQHVFFVEYQYLQLAVSIFAMFLTKSTLLFFQQSVLNREPIDGVLLSLTLVMTLAAGAIFPALPILLRCSWSMI